jgi:hypothetical protein
MVWMSVYLDLRLYVLLAPISSFEGGSNWVSGICMVFNGGFGFGGLVVGASALCGMGVDFVVFSIGSGVVWF